MRHIESPPRQNVGEGIISVDIVLKITIPKIIQIFRDIIKDINISPKEQKGWE